jgi:hypothetical protein
VKNRSLASCILAVTLVGCTTPVANPPGADLGVTPNADLAVAPQCPEGAACDDGQACTTDDRCHAGYCTGTATDSCGLVVQEWGTYTSVEASDGHALGGVHHVDEALPTWVHSRNWSNRSAYFFEQLPEEPLQQLETPVLYFWAPEVTTAHIAIDFPQGVVGEWYPDAAAYTPAIGNCTSIGGGQMSWDVTLDPSIATSSFAAVDPTNIWAPSRNVASTPVKNDKTAEAEQFIFYRGLGKFDPPVHVVAGGDGQLRVTNSSSDDLAAAFVLVVDGNQGQVVSVGALHGGETRAVPVPAATRDLDGYVADAQGALHGALVGSGLKDDVARAMVDTWTRSWFKNEGLRVLYLAPRSWTDGYLPTTITPAPSAFVRTLVGRVEIIQPSEESALVANVRAHAISGEPLDLTTLGRFAEPRLRRTLELLDPKQDDIAYAQSLIDQAHMQP